jgi:hypothetical protein
MSSSRRLSCGKGEESLSVRDIGLGNPYSVVCESVETVHPIQRDRLLVACDNNFPNKGRNPNLADDNEFVVVKVDGLDAAF